MTIVTKHFDTRLNQWIHTDGNTSNPESLLKEELNNTLLEFFFPGKEFSFGHMDEYSTEQELKNHPDDRVLLLSSKSRLLYGPQECVEVINQLCPDRKDRGAYGSIFLGSCKNAINEELNILIVDDSNGENGGIINNDQAYRLTGDCYGQISTNVYHRLTAKEPDSAEPYRIIQHRFGWTSQDGDDQTYRFGKGTLRPNNLDHLDYKDLNNKVKIDLVIPLSSFKGTDKDRPQELGGPLKPQIKPGLYKQKIWLGEKSQSERGKTAISQLIASFPNGMKDFAEELEAKAIKLRSLQKDPRRVAELYCEKYEKRKAFTEEQKSELLLELTGVTDKKEALEKLKIILNNKDSNEELTPSSQKWLTTVQNSLNYDEDVESFLEEEFGNEREDLFMYQLIKTDLMGHCQLLETEKVKQELERFLQKEWRDIAIGKELLFERAMVIPSKDLKNGEICIPWYEEGEEVLNFRSPFLNANGLCVSVNKHVEDVKGPDGRNLDGAIAVSDETFDKIYKRITSQVKEAIAKIQEQSFDYNPSKLQEYVNTDTSSLEISEKIEFAINFRNEISKLKEFFLAGVDDFTITVNKTESSFKEFVSNIDSIVLESEQERQARDYDGDCIGVDKARKYPNLTAEAKYRNQLENAYEPTVKLKKQSFYREDGTQPEFEEIAIHMSDGISVGIINNHLTAIEALESEITILKNFGDTKQKLQLQSDYIDTVANHYRKLFKDANNENPKYQKPIREEYVDYMKEFVELASVQHRDPEIMEKALDINTKMYRKMIQEAAFQNQIAVDLFKSAKRPEMEIIQENRRYLYRDVNYIKDKKNKDVYINRGIAVTGYSPVELLTNQANKYFEQSQLESRPVSQFQKLFKGIEYTNQQELQAILAKKEFDTKFNEASRLKKRKETEKGPYAIVTTNNGEKLEITNLTRYNHSGIWKANEINLRLQEIPVEKRSAEKPHKYFVWAQVDGETEEGKPKYRASGTLSQSTSSEIKIKPNEIVSSSSIELKPELSEGQIKLLFQQAQEITEKYYNSISESERLSAAAAAWNISTTRESESEASKIESDCQAPSKITKKTSNFVFAAFPKEIVAQVKDLQFDEVRVIGNYTTNTFGEENRDKIHQVKIEFDKDLNRRVVEIQTENGSSKVLGWLEDNTSRLPIGSTAEAKIIAGDTFTATATLQIPGKPEINFKIEQIKKFAFAGTTFNGEKTNLTIGNVKIPDGNVEIMASNQKIGRIEPKSLEEARNNGWIKEGQPLQLKLKSIVDKGKGAYIIGETIEGHNIRIKTDQRLKDKFDDKEFRQVKTQACTPERTVVMSDSKVVGIVRLNEDKQKLEQVGALKKGQLTTVPCKIESNFSHCDVQIDAKTVRYPEIWTKENPVAQKTQEETNPQREATKKNSEYLISKITERPTIIFQDREDKTLGTISIAIDNHKVDIAKKWLESQGINFDLLPASQTRLEAKKGLVVFTLAESTISTENYETLIKKFGDIADATRETTIPLISEQTVHFYNPNQGYTYEKEDGTSDREEKEAFGIVVPAQDAIQVYIWLDSQGVESSYFTENNCATFIIEKSQISEKSLHEIGLIAGEAINIGDIDGYTLYEQKVAQLNDDLSKNDSKLSLQSPDKSEYQKILLSLPNRPTEVANEPDKKNPRTIVIPVKPPTAAQTPTQPSNTVATTEQIYTRTPSTDKQPQQPQQPISLPNSRQADQTKPIEILGKISSEKVEQLRQHLENYIKPVLESDKSNYAPGRLLAWVGAKWDLKEKDFKPGVQDDALMKLVKQVYPNADIVLATYSEQPGAGINYHRDDSYAAVEARSINIGNSDWGYRAAQEQMTWTKNENTAATYQEFKLESGTVTRFNSKNEHAAINTEAGRWSINIWSIKNDLGKENSVRQKFENFLASNQPPRAVVNTNDDLTIKADEWTPGGEIKVDRSYANLKETTRNTSSHLSNQPSVQELISIGNLTTVRAQNPQIPDNPTISGKPVPMVYSLHMHGESSKVPVNTTIDAMRGYGRVHTTRGVDYQKSYGIKEGDIAIAVGKNNEQVAFRVGKQYEITPQMIQDPAYQQAWANWEKHSPKELTQTQANKSKVYGLFMEPLGDYINGKIVPFPSVQKQTATSINISPDSKDGLGAIKVISGGQTGADMGGLQGAKALGLPTGGTAAAGWMTENGANPNLQEYGLVEGEKGSTTAQTYANRTVENIRHSDGTAIFGDKSSPGSQQTIKAAEQLNKPVLHVPLDTTLNNRPAAAQQLRDFVEQNNVQTLNIAGNRESKAPGLQAAVAEIVQMALDRERGTTVTQQPVTAPIATTTSLTPKRVIAEGINISSGCPDPLGAALTNATVRSKEKNKIKGDYPVSFRDNAEVKAGKYEPEVYTENKSAGIPFASAEQAYQCYKETVPLGEPRVQLMAEIIQAKLEQHPKLVDAITARGGVDWLKNCSHYVTSTKDNYWEGKGINSPFIRALVEGYSKVLENSKQSSVVSSSQEATKTSTPSNPVQAEEKPQNLESIKPATDISNSSVSTQLKVDTTSQKLPQTGVVSEQLENYKLTTLQNLRNWYETARTLGKSEKYLNRIAEIGQEFKTTNEIGDNALIAMNKDIKELASINEITKMAQRIGDNFGNRNGDTIEVKGKEYDISLNPAKKNMTITSKTSEVVLNIEQGIIKENSVIEDVRKYFSIANLKIDNALNKIKIEIVEQG
ncbi:hypothetical protein WA1_50190 [Scytonema hofmannii PCC 7110]|uniref:Uncharacterized protein n=1 Tax=Scytonema hofmannii PCC 7110 TaxID=128403 RepID=A0A139WR50_9CYAN|nr:putative molybdenum carrier protein [Scytonema hofmannii]KYC34898.1 hypothetical protein WA1_50190 [Scytonema hofmannii PCC 7110]